MVLLITLLYLYTLTHLPLKVNDATQVWAQVILVLELVSFHMDASQLDAIYLFWYNTYSMFDLFEYY